MTAEEELNADGERVQKLVEQLSEHFDSVHIFAMRHDGSKAASLCVNRHAGSWFSRYAQIREWLVYEDELIRCKARTDHEQISEDQSD